MSTANGVRCASVISTGEFDPRANEICMAMAYINTTEAVKCLEAVKNNSFDASAAHICRLLAPVRAGMAVNCAVTIANMSFKLGATKVCKTMVYSGPRDTVACLKNSGYHMKNDEDEIVEVKLSTLLKLQRKIKRSIKKMSHGNLYGAKEDLLKVNDKLEELTE